MPPKLVFSLKQEKFRKELATSDDLVARSGFWNKNTNEVFGLGGRYKELNCLDKDPELQQHEKLDEFILRLFKLCFRLEELHYDNATERAQEGETVTEEIVKCILPVRALTHSHSHTFRLRSRSLCTPARRSSTILRGIRFSGNFS